MKLRELVLSRAGLICFQRRENGMQELAARRGVVLEQCNLAELDALWDEAKRNG